MGRFSSKEDLVESLTQVCIREEIKGGEVRVRGRVRGAELVRLNSETRQYEVMATVAGEVDLVHGNGVIAVLGDQVILRIDAVMSAHGPLGGQTLAGQLRAASVVDVEFVLDVFDDLTINRALDRDTGGLVLDSIQVVASPDPAPVAAKPAVKPAAKPAAKPAPAQVELAVTSAPEPKATPEAAPETKMSWGEAVAATDATKKSGAIGVQRPSGTSSPTADEIYADIDLDGEDEELPAMKPGDLIDHPKLGRCRVMRVEDEEYAHIRLPRGKISKLMLDLFDVSFGGKENGKNIFTLRMHV